MSREILRTSNFPSSSNFDRRVTLKFEGSKFPDQLKCPICIQVPEDEIYQCKNGHTLCGRCYKNVQNCPQCRVALLVDGAPIRNRAMESLLSSLLIPCPYKTQGCNETIRRNLMNNHKINCKYNGKCESMCVYLGYRCGFLINALNAGPSVEHFCTNHAAILSQAFNVEIKIENFLKTVETLTLKGPDASSKTQDGMWEPIIFKLGNGVHAMLVTFINGEDHSLAFCSFQLTDSNCETTLSAKLSINSIKQNMPELCWTIGAIPLTQSEEILKDVPLRIPLQLIRQNYIVANSLIVKCNIQSQGFLRPAHQISLTRLASRQKPSPYVFGSLFRRASMVCKKNL